MRTPVSIRWRRVASVVAALALALVFSACASGAPEQSGTDSSGTVDWWGYTPDTAVAEQYIAEFNKAYPDIKVTYKNLEADAYKGALRSALTANAGPDVFDIQMGGGSADFASFGSFTLDLAPALKNSLGEGWADKLTFDQSGFTKEDGGVGGVSMGGVIDGILWINQTMLTQYGAAVPTTYDELVQACKVLAEAGKSCIAAGTGGCCNYALNMWRVAVSSIEPGIWWKALSGEADWSEPAFLKGLELIKKMKDDGVWPNDVTGLAQYPDANNAFFSESAGMVQMGTWYSQYSIADRAKAAMEGAGVSNPTPFVQLPIRWPILAEGGSVPDLYAEVDYGLAVNNQSKNIAPATTFVMWLTTSKEGTQMIANAIDLVPGVKGVEPDWNNLGLVDPSVQIPALQQIYATGSEAVEGRTAPASPELLDALNNAPIAVLSGSSTPEEAIADLVAATKGK